VEVLLPKRQRPVYLCERCGQLCERGSTTVAARFDGGSLHASGAPLQLELTEPARED
jgi:hypothetical protein